MTSTCVSVDIAPEHAIADIGAQSYRSIDAATARRVAGEFHAMVRQDRDTLPYFAADGVDALRWHQAAELLFAMGGPDWYETTGVPRGRVPLAVPAVLFHRSAFYLVRALDREGVPRAVVAHAALALGARTCRMIGGPPVPAALVPCGVPVDGGW